MSQAPHLSRRQILASAAVLSVATGAQGQTPGEIRLWIGTYSGPGHKGAIPLKLDLATDQLSLGPALPQIENASFAVHSARHACTYVLDEQKQGALGVFAPDGASVRQIARVSTLGDSPCYLALDKTESFAAVANYYGGNVVIYRLDPATGAPLPSPVNRSHTGHGPNKDRQEAPHAHWVQFAPEQTHIYSIDLGTDEILGYSFDAASGAVGPMFTAVKLPAGVGPRHMVFHPDGAHAFVLTELDNSVLALKRLPGGTFAVLSRHSTLPDGFTGHSQAAHLILSADGTRLYASNRGHNSVAVFAVGPGAALNRLQIVASGGDWPRFFLLLEAEKRMIVAHQNSGDLILFKVLGDGTLAAAGASCQTASPVFIGRA